MERMEEGDVTDGVSVRDDRFGEGPCLSAKTAVVDPTCNSTL